METWYQTNLKRKSKVRLGRALGIMARRSYLRLDAVQTSEPEDLASPQLHLGVVDLVGALRQLLLVDLLLRGAVTCLLQELQVVCGDGRDQLR